MKAQSKTFKGIDYVQVSLLPKDQYISIQETINNGFFIKILIDGKVVGNCLQYKDYELWYENVFKSPALNGEGISATDHDDVVKLLAKGREAEHFEHQT